jgi:ribosomal protein S18 acetylase RimI-like enzyme
VHTRHDDITIRPIRPEDKDILAAGFALLSDETRRRRFLAPKPRLTAGDLRYLTEIDGCDHAALVAIDHGDPALGTVGVARYVRLADEPTTAEMSIVVGDCYQGRGLGKALADRLIAVARENGIEHFTASVLADNDPAQRLIAHMTQHLPYVSNGAGRERIGDNAA